MQFHAIKTEASYRRRPCLYFQGNLKLRDVKDPRILSNSLSTLPPSLWQGPELTIGLFYSREIAMYVHVESMPHQCH